MEIEINDASGKSVWLFADDNLDEAPESHRDLITPSIRAVFSDPPAYFREIWSRCPFAKMKAWLGVLLEENNWALVLHRGDPPEWNSAGFAWASDNVLGAEITPASSSIPVDLPEALRRYYSLSDDVRWIEFGGAGGFNGCREQTPISDIGAHYTANVDAAKTFIFGWSPSGDMLIYTVEDKAGWLSHENGQVLWLGSIADTIDWVYNELLNNRVPDLDYDSL
jgi:hypothetical protein